MEECLEVIFVELGMYEIGFEINKKQFMSIRFGMSTIIGGFQIVYNKRYSFKYRCCKNMRCLAIRKQQFMRLLENFPTIKQQVVSKFFSSYSQDVYQPLMKKKNFKILSYNYRDDYN